MSRLSVGSLFSGIGGFDLGLERNGFDIRWQCEIDTAAQSVLRRHWPDAVLYDDVTTLGGDVERVDLICGGFPCQDLSVAGRRAGLAGERSGLFYEFMRIADECAPTWVLIENVPGLLSSNGGRDMGAVLGTLGDLGYGWAYRVLDAQYFGVAQRRRRVFIVGCLGDPARAVQVLFEPESLPGDTPPRREAGARLATDTAACIRSGGEGKRGWIGDAEHGLVAACLNSGGNNGGFRTEPEEHLVPVANGITGRYAKGTDSDATDTMVVAHALTAEGHDASEDGTGRGTPLVVMAPAFSKRPGQQIATRQDGLSYALTTGEPPRVLPFDTTQVTSASNYSNPKPGAPCHPLASGAHAPAVAFEPGSVARNAGPAGESPQCPTLRSDMGDNQPAIRQGMAVRRLTPIECERLQGFPDGWTDGQSDSARYRQLGNAVCVNVAEWIGRCIMEVAA